MTEEIFLEVREPGRNWSRVGGQSFVTTREAINHAELLNNDVQLQSLGYEYRAVKIQKVIL